MSLSLCTLRRRLGRAVRAGGGLWLAAALALAACGKDNHGRPTGALRVLHSPRPPASGLYMTAEKVAELRLPAVPRSMVLDGSALYVFLNQQGLATVDVSDMAHPRLASHLPGPPKGLARADDLTHAVEQQHHYCYSGLAEPGRLLVADRWRGGVTVFDTREPLRPRALFTTPIPGLAPNHILRLGSQYLVSAGPQGVFALPEGFGPTTTPRSILSQYDFVSQCAYLAPNWLLVADGYDGGVQIHDLSDPAQPRLAHHLMTGSFCDSLAIFEHFAVINSRNSGALTLDLSDPRRPYLLSLFSTVSRAQVKCIERLEHERLAIGYSVGCIDVLDLRDPARPGWLARVPVHAEVNCLAGRGEYLLAGLNLPPSLNLERTSRQLTIFRLTAKTKAPALTSAPPKVD